METNGKRREVEVSITYANFVSFVDYLAGRKSGFYFLSLATPYQKEEDDTNNKKIDYTNIMKEVLRQCIRQKLGFHNLIITRVLAAFRSMDKKIHCREQILSHMFLQTNSEPV